MLFDLFWYEKYPNITGLIKDSNRERYRKYLNIAGFSNRERFQWTFRLGLWQKWKSIIGASNFACFITGFVKCFDFVFQSCWFWEVLLDILKIVLRDVIWWIDFTEDCNQFGFIVVCFFTAKWMWQKKKMLMAKKEKERYCKYSRDKWIMGLF